MSVQMFLLSAFGRPSVPLLGTVHREVSALDKAPVTVILSVIHQAFIEHQLCSRFSARCSINNKVCKC